MFECGASTWIIIMLQTIILNKGLIVCDHSNMTADFSLGPISE